MIKEFGMSINPSQVKFKSFRFDKHLGPYHKPYYGDPYCLLDYEHRMAWRCIDSHLMTNGRYTQDGKPNVSFRFDNITTDGRVIGNAIAWLSIKDMIYHGKGFEIHRGL